MEAYSAGHDIAIRRVGRCILLATDFERSARQAFTYAVMVAITLKARLEIVHVIKAVSPSALTAPSSRRLNVLKTSALLKLGRLARLAQEAGADAEPRLLFGVPAACILDFAKQVRAQMIVMGTEGRTGWDRLRLGSTVQAVVRAVACPVLSVHGRVAGDTVRHPHKVKLERIVAATDFSSCADRAVSAAAELAHLTAARIYLLHVAVEGAVRKQAQQKLESLARDLRRNGLRVQPLSCQGDPVETILNQAARWRADLIAVGTKGRQGLSRMMLGSIAEALLGRAGCPVLVVRKEARLSFATTHAGEK